MSLSGNTFRLVWTNATHSDDHSAKTFEVLGDRESVWGLWYLLTFKSKLLVEPKVYSMDGIEQNPMKGVDSLSGLNPYLPFKEKENLVP